MLLQSSDDFREKLKVVNGLKDILDDIRKGIGISEEMVKIGVNLTA